MTRELFYQAILKFILGIVVVGILIFLPAGTFYYWNAWLFMSILFIPMLFAGIVMMFKNPELLKKRLNAKEQQAEQRLVVKISGLMFVFLSALCRGITGKCLLIKDCRSSAGSESD